MHRRPPARPSLSCLWARRAGRSSPCCDGTHTHPHAPRTRLSRAFVPPSITLKQLHDAVPKHLLQKDAVRSTGYVLRDVFFCILFFGFGASIEPLVTSSFGGYVPLTSVWQLSLARATLWVVYWWWQGIAFASFFCIGQSFCRARCSSGC